MRTDLSSESNFACFCCAVLQRHMLVVESTTHNLADEPEEQASIQCFSSYSRTTV